MQKLNFFFLMLIFPFLGKSQEVWTTYKRSDGLANDYVRSIAIDADGNKWFGTNGGGVSKFDGTNWTTYNTSNGLVNNLVWSIATEIKGDNPEMFYSNMWFGTVGNGVSKFDGVNWTSYSLPNNNAVSCILIDSHGNKWFSNARGISKFDGTNWTFYNHETTNGGLESDWSYSIAIDLEDNMWFGNFLGVSKFDGINWTKYIVSHPYNSVFSIAIDSEGNKWFGTSGGGVSKFDGTNWTTYTTADGLVDNNILSIAIDSDDNKWFGTYGGVSKFDGVNWTNYTTFDGLANNAVYAIAIDKDDNKWFATDGGGVSKLSKIATVTLNLLSFTGENISIGNFLKWQTMNERNHKGFSIERSSNEKDFQKIGFITGKNTAERQNYVFTDAQAPVGKSYYRLKMEDINGTVEYSPVIVLENKLQNTASSMYPNPVKSQLFFTTQHIGKTLNIYNISGKQILKQQITGQNNAIDVSSFIKGIYVYRYGNEKGKFVKE